MNGLSLDEESGHLIAGAHWAPLKWCRVIIAAWQVEDEINE